MTPGQTWLINEMVNDVRRVYNDGREHTPDADAFRRGMATRSGSGMATCFVNAYQAPDAGQ